MKKMLLSLSVVALTAALSWAGDHGCKGDCPSQLEGAQVAVENSADGVIVRISAKDPAVIKKIQESAAEHFKKAAKGHDCKECRDGKKCAKCAAGKKGHKKEMKGEKYVCPMDCASSDKPGKCPKCGMDMKKEEGDSKRK